MGTHKRVVVLLASSLAALMASFGVAYALGVGTDSVRDESGFRGGPKQEVASGYSGLYGRWVMYVRTDDHGQQCHGEQLLDSPGGGYGEGCGGLAGFPVRSLVGPGGTLMLGFVPAGATKVRLDIPGRPSEELDVITGADGQGVVSASVFGQPKGVKMTPIDAHGAEGVAASVPTG